MLQVTLRTSDNTVTHADAACQQVQSLSELPDALWTHTLTHKNKLKWQLLAANATFTAHAGHHQLNSNIHAPTHFHPLTTTT